MNSKIDDVVTHADHTHTHTHTHTHIHTYTHTRTHADHQPELQCSALNKHVAFNSPVSHTHTQTHTHTHTTTRTNTHTHTHNHTHNHTHIHMIACRQTAEVPSCSAAISSQRVLWVWMAACLVWYICTVIGVLSHTSLYTHTHIV